jgi:hypothetical protein
VKIRPVPGRFNFKLAIQAQFVGFRREIRFGETPGDYDGVFLQQSRVGGALAIREIQIL